MPKHEVRIEKRMQNNLIWQAKPKSDCYLNFMRGWKKFPKHGPRSLSTDSEWIDFSEMCETEVEIIDGVVIKGFDTARTMKDKMKAYKKWNVDNNDA